MLRLILLLSPIYISLFWTIILFSSDDNHRKQKNGLGMFMLLSFVVFSCQFIYFRPYHELYPYFNFPLRFAALMAYPIFHIYFRVITVDSKFSWRIHWRYFSFQLFVIALYGVSIALTPQNEYRAWLYNTESYPDSIAIQFLNITAKIVQLTFLIQVLATIIGNFVLIKKYREKAEQFYSNIIDEKIDKTIALSISIALMSLSSFILVALGQNFLMLHDQIVDIGWFIISITLFVLGFMGSQQKTILVNFDTEELTGEQKEEEVEGIFRDVNTMMEKLVVEFEKNKIYLNSQLNIIDVAQIVGSNRTYISMLINQHFNQNFSTFVNNYRFMELERIVQQEPNLSNEDLIDRCGFGSLNSMKRAVLSKTGLSIKEWKEQISI